MTFPFFSRGLFTESTSLILAVMIGIGFGFFLERGGLGNAKKLAGQFYLKDLTVFKVMFTAIITAMLGVFWLGQAGLLDITLIYFSPTYVIPQAIAGLIFGAGFIIAGLCPGTSCVAIATGKLDGLAVVGGILAGVTLFAFIFPGIENFYYSTAMGQVSLDQVAGVNPGLIVVIIVLIAIGGFLIAEKIEGNPIKIPKLKRNLALLVLLVFSIYTIKQDPFHYQIESIESDLTQVEWGDRIINGMGVHDLADRIIQKQDSLLIIDLRTDEDIEIYNIPGSVKYSTTQDFTSERILVLVSKFGDTVPLSLMRNSDISEKLYILKGGMEAWKKLILFPDLSYTRLSENDKKKVARISRYFGGDPLLPRIKPGSAGSKYMREGC